MRKEPCSSPFKRGCPDLSGRGICCWYFAGESDEVIRKRNLTILKPEFRCNFKAMTRTVRLACDDPERVELLLKVAREMGIQVLDEETDALVHEPELTYEQKQLLDERRATSKKEDFIPWDDAKKQLKSGKK